MDLMTSTAAVKPSMVNMVRVSFTFFWISSLMEGISPCLICSIAV